MKKKVFIMLLISVLFFIGVNRVYAINMTVEKAEVNAGDEIKINFTDAKVSEVSTGPLYEFGNDKSDNLTRKSYNGFSGVENLFFTSTTGYIVYTTKEVNADYTVTFSIKDLNNNAVLTKQVKVKSKNTTTTKTTTTTTTSKASTTTTTTTSSKSNNANLKSISIIDKNNKEINYSPEFSSSVYEYNATVDSSISSVTVNVTLENDKANVIISNADELVAGENNKITITVTAEDGITKKAYVLNIKRKALDGNAYLSSLEIKEYPELKFKSDQFTYTIKVDDAVDKLTIDYSVTSSSSVVTITDNSDLKDGSKVKILVEAEDGSKREYTLKISKTSEKESTKEEVKETYQTQRNPIIIMLLSIVAFSLLGSIIYVAKK